MSELTPKKPSKKKQANLLPDGVDAQMSKENLTPQEIVLELDKYIIGQKEAKKAVAIALRNRTRRRLVKDELQDEISPKNIIMIGATGVGKTEIARRLAKLTQSPFIKVEATKFTEVGYVGRDVESIVRDLVTRAVNIEKSREGEKVEKESEVMTEEKILATLFPEAGGGKKGQASSMSISLGNQRPAQPDQHSMSEEGMQRTREKMRAKLRNGDFEDKYIDVEVNQKMKRNAFIEFGPEQGLDQMDQMVQNIVGQINGANRFKKMKVRDARKILKPQFVEKLIDMEKVVQTAIEKTENMGIVFIDEIDKVATRENVKGVDVSREGVQRDFLPLVEGCTVNTRHGAVKTDHILFIASGAFHQAKPSDLIPELQGRFPIRVELNVLSVKDMYKILTEPKNALLKQYQALLKTEDVDIKFENQAIEEIAKIASEVNKINDNIGARRLSTVMEKLLEDILYKAPNVDNKIVINAAYVTERLEDIKKDKDLSKYIL